MSPYRRFWVKTFLKVLLMFSSSLQFLAAPVQADIIVDISDGLPGANAISDRFTTEEHWFTPTGYTNVSVTPFLGNFSGSPLPMRYFLTTRIGPGTTIADQAAAGDFTLPVGFRGFTTVANGLTIGPGTYYLTFSTPCPGTGLCGGWEMEPVFIPPVLGPGVTVGSATTSIGPPLAPYVPATPFFPNDSFFQLRVNGDPIPEPSGLWLFCVGLAVLVSVRGRIVSGHG